MNYFILGMSLSISTISIIVALDARSIVKNMDKRFDAYVHSNMKDMLAFIDTVKITSDESQRDFSAISTNWNELNNRINTLELMMIEGKK